MSQVEQQYLLLKQKHPLADKIINFIYNYTYPPSVLEVNLEDTNGKYIPEVNFILINNIHDHKILFHELTHALMQTLYHNFANPYAFAPTDYILSSAAYLASFMVSEENNYFLKAYKHSQKVIYQEAAYKTYKNVYSLIYPGRSIPGNEDVIEVIRDISGINLLQSAHLTLSQRKIADRLNDMLESYYGFQYDRELIAIYCELLVNGKINQTDVETILQPIGQYIQQFIEPILDNPSNIVKYNLYNSYIDYDKLY
jgi:hypothetical protein